MASQERFGYKWEKHSQIFLDEHRVQFEKWIFPLRAKDFKGKKVLDVGCGIGRNAYFFLMDGAKLTAFDADKRTIKACRLTLLNSRRRILFFLMFMIWTGKTSLTSLSQ